MSLVKSIKEKGVSLRLTSIFTFLISLAITAVLLFSSVRTLRAFDRMSQATDSYIEMQEAANDLMSASDYLTEEAQCFTVIGDRVHLENYFREAEQNRRRENALLVMSQKAPDSKAFTELQAAMNESLALMEREYYAMRLVLDAQGDRRLPAALEDVVLTDRDAALSPEEKMALARELMHNEGYYVRKNEIRRDMTKCVEELKRGTHGTQEEMETAAHNDLKWMTILIIVQSLAILIMLWLTSRLGIRPVLLAVDHIRHDEKLPIMGAHEFRYLAGTYNKMYTAYKRSIENLNYKASHDELTGVYNRAGYDLIRESVDVPTTAMLLCDADYFKQINDTQGHETGDAVLKKIARALKANFRSDDYVCRIGGDEFVVFMVHVGSNYHELIENKVRAINAVLSDTSDGLPPITLSVGVAGCDDSPDSHELFRRADTALYYVKDHGRHNCCFYSEDMGLK